MYIMGYFFHYKMAPKTKFLLNIKNFSSFLKICIQFQVWKFLYPLEKQKHMIKFEIFEKKNKVLVSDKKFQLQAPKLDLDFSSWYQNLVSVAH